MFIQQVQDFSQHQGTAMTYLDLEVLGSIEREVGGEFQFPKTIWRALKLSETAYIRENTTVRKYTTLLVGLVVQLT
jgi:hypothetical protein